METKENKTELQQPPQNDGKTFGLLGLVVNSMDQIHLECAMSGDSTQGLTLAVLRAGRQQSRLSRAEQSR